MLNSLKQFYQTDQPRLFVPKLPSLFINYLPTDGEVALLTDFDLARSSSFGYAKNIFGIPKFHYSSESALSQPMHVLASDYRTEQVNLSQKLGGIVADRYWQINNKAYFQQVVQSVLGSDYSTNPFIIGKNTSLPETILQAEKYMKRMNSPIVIRIADGKVASGSGKGVRFVHDAAELFALLPQMHASLWANNRLQSDILLEYFIPHDLSPSTTYFIGSDGVTSLTVNQQFIKNGKFVGGTNYFPPHMHSLTHLLQEKGMLLAKNIFHLGGRGFVGFDWVIGKQIIAIEANYRATKTTTAEILVQKAQQFTVPYNATYWIVYSRIPYTRKVSHFTALLDFLQKEKLLYTGKHESAFLTPKIIPHSDVKGMFDLLLVWDKSLHLSYTSQKMLLHRMIAKMNDKNEA